MARTLETRGLLLRSVNYGEADRICSFLTAEAGKVEVFARRARGSTRRFRGGLDAFCEIHLNLAESRNSELLSLRDSEAIQSFGELGQNLQRLSAGSYVLELFDRTLLTGQGQPLYPALLGFLRWLASEDATLPRIQPGVHRLELRLLNELGLLPDFQICARSGESLQGQDELCWLPDVGVIRGSERFGGERGALMSAQAFAILCDVLQGRFPEYGSPDARTELRVAMLRVWQHILGQTLRSWEFYDSEQLAGW